MAWFFTKLVPIENPRWQLPLDIVYDICPYRKMNIHVRWVSSKFEEEDFYTLIVQHIYYIYLQKSIKFSQQIICINKLLITMKYFYFDIVFIDLHY